MVRPGSRTGSPRKPGLALALLRPCPTRCLLLFTQGLHPSLEATKSGLCVPAVHVLRPSSPPSSQQLHLCSWRRRQRPTSLCRRSRQIRVPIRRPRLAGACSAWGLRQPPCGTAEQSVFRTRGPVRREPAIFAFPSLDLGWGSAPPDALKVILTAAPSSWWCGRSSPASMGSGRWEASQPWRRQCSCLRPAQSLALLPLAARHSLLRVSRSRSVRFPCSEKTTSAWGCAVVSEPAHEKRGVTPTCRPEIRGNVSRVSSVFRKSSAAFRHRYARGGIVTDLPTRQMPILSLRSRTAPESPQNASADACR